MLEPKSDTSYVWDGRWTGRHGIARFASELSARLAQPSESLSNQSVKPASVFDPLYINWSMSRTKEKLFVSPGFNAGLGSGYSQLLTIHDLIHVLDPLETSQAKKAYYQHIVKPAVRRSAAVMTVSEFSKSCIVEWFDLDPTKVKVVGNGNSMPISTSLSESEGNFVLFVGNEKPHKNFRLLAKASRYLDSSLRIKTVGLSSSFVYSVCEDLKVDTNRFILCGAVSDDELKHLYSSANCLAVPSSHEGFGLIALEAMSRGTPTAYCCSAVQEVVGQTGSRSIDPLDARSYAAAVERACAQKVDLFTDLVTRARKFSWDKVATNVRAIIDHLSL